jgi:peroxiredoxin
MPSPPDVGAIAPDFTLPSTQGPITLSERLRKRAVLLVFYQRRHRVQRQLCDYRSPGGVRGLGVDVLALNP